MRGIYINTNLYDVKPSDDNSKVELQHEFAFISKFYSSFLSDLKVKDLRKIVIAINDPYTREGIEPSDKYIKVCVITKKLSYDNLIIENSEEKRLEFMLNYIHEILINCAQELRWPLDPFEFAYSKILELNYKFQYTLIREKYSKNRRYSISIEVDVLINYNLISLKITDFKSDLIKPFRFDLMKASVYVDDLSGIVKTFSWINNEEIVISNKEKEINFKFSILEKKLELFLTPTNNSEEYLLDEFKLFSAETSNEECLRILRSRAPRIE